MPGRAPARCPSKDGVASTLDHSRADVGESHGPQSAANDRRRVRRFRAPGGSLSGSGSPAVPAAGVGSNPPAGRPSRPTAELNVIDAPPKPAVLRCGSGSDAALRYPLPASDPGRAAARRHEALPERQRRAPPGRPVGAGGRLRLSRRPVGRRQVDAHQAAHSRRAGHRGRGLRRRPEPEPDLAPPGPEDPAPDRDRLPGLQAAAGEERLRERGVRPRGHGDAAQQDPAIGGAGPRARWTDGPGEASCRHSSRAASSSGRRSRERWSTTRA